MRRIAYFLSFAFIYLIISAKSCNQNEENRSLREQKSFQSTRDSLISVSTSDTPNALSLHAYEATAKVKFLDFIDYLNIIDTISTPAFRELTKKQLLNAFISSDCIFQFKGTHQKDSHPVTLLKLVDSDREGRKKICGIFPDSIRIQEPLQEIKPGTYTGRLAFSKKPDGSPQTGHYSGTVEIWLIKKKMIFDKDTIHAWTVLLGNYCLN
jgi:hypothetical protein